MLAALIALISSLASAQTFPSRPIRMVVAYAPGGTTDLLARSIAVKLSETWKQSVVVDNRSGGGGIIGTETVAKAAPDGHTLLLSPPAPISINVSLHKSLPYDPFRQLTPITLIATTPSLLLVPAKSPVISVSNLIASAKAQSQGMTYASTGNGSPSHLMGALFALETQTNLVHVPYKGTGPALVDLIGARVDFMFNTIPAILPNVRSNQLRALGVTGAKRFSALPDVPTMREAGLASIQSSGWYGLLAPAGVPPAILSRIHDYAVKVIASPEIQAKLAPEGAELIGNTPAQFAQFIKEDVARWKRVISEAKITAD